MAVAAPDTRAMQLDLFDAFCRRQIERIQRDLADGGRIARERERLHENQPEQFEHRGHAVGARRPSLSEIEGDE